MLSHDMQAVHMEGTKGLHGEPQNSLRPQPICLAEHLAASLGDAAFFSFTTKPQSLGPASVACNPEPARVPSAWCLCAFVVKLTADRAAPARRHSPRRGENPSQAAAISRSAIYCAARLQAASSPPWNSVQPSCPPCEPLACHASAPTASRSTMATRGHNRSESAPKDRNYR